MTPEENGIMRDAYYFLRDHSNPPAMGTDECAEFFSNTAQELAKLVSVTWKNHPLAQCVMMGIFDYLGEKCKAGGQS